MLEGLAGRASELKQQGALEASRDPSSPVDAEQAERSVLKEARASGAAAFAFDPNASPEEKRRQLQEVPYLRAFMPPSRAVGEQGADTASSNPESSDLTDSTRLQPWQATKTTARRLATTSHHLAKKAR